VLPILLIITFGIIDFGAVYSNYLQVRQGTREGARQTAVSTTPTAPGGSGWGVSNCTTTGISTSGDGYDLVCFTKNRIGLSEANTRVSIYFAAPWTPGNGVTVCTEFAASSVTGFFASLLNGDVLQSHIEIRIEQPSSTFTAPVQETPLPGHPWPASCSTT